MTAQNPKKAELTAKANQNKSIKEITIPDEKKIFSGDKNNFGSIDIFNNSSSAMSRLNFR